MPKMAGIIEEGVEGVEKSKRGKVLSLFRPTAPGYSNRKG